MAVDFLLVAAPVAVQLFVASIPTEVSAAVTMAVGIGLVAPFFGLVASEAAGGMTPGAGLHNLALWAPGHHRPSWRHILLRAPGHLLDFATLGTITRFADVFSGTRIVQRSRQPSGLDRSAGGRAIEAYLAVGLMPGYLALSALVATTSASHEGVVGLILASLGGATAVCWGGRFLLP